MSNDEANSRLRVECYAGHRADEEPRHFTLGKRRIGVDEVLDRWLDPDYRYFKLRGSDGGIYILRNRSGADSWEITFYDSGLRDDIRLSST